MSSTENITSSKSQRPRDKLFSLLYIINRNSNIIIITNVIMGQVQQLASAAATTAVAATTAAPAMTAAPTTTASAALLS